MVILAARHVEDVGDWVVTLAGLIVGGVTVDAAWMGQHGHDGLEGFDRVPLLRRHV